MRAVGLLTTIALASLLAGCAKPIAAERAAYVGQWSGGETALQIRQDGTVDYKTKDGGVNKSVAAPLKEFIGNDFVVGVGPMSTTFVVSAPSRQADGVWKMTVDGVELTRAP